MKHFIIWTLSFPLFVLCTFANTETFFEEAPLNPRFLHGGVAFGLTGDFLIREGEDLGFNGDNKWLGSGIGDGASLTQVGSIQVSTVDAGFEIFEMYVYTSSDDGRNQSAGQITLIGTTFDGKTITQTFSTSEGGNTEQSYEHLKLGNAWAGKILVEMQFVLSGNLNYIRIDDVKMKTYTSYPVVWGDLSAQYDKYLQGVIFSWETLREENVWGFQVQRRRGEGSWTDLAWLDGSGNSDIPLNYEYVDASASPGLNQYRLKQIDIDGQTHYSVTIESMVGTDALGNIRWNDQHDMLICSHNMDQNGVSLQVFSVFGQNISTRPLTKGTHAIQMGDLPGGVYIAQLVVDDWVRTFRFVQK